LLQVAKKHKPVGATRIVTCIEACCPSCPCKTKKGDPPYIVMEYAGQDGLEWLKKHRYDKAGVANILTQMMQAIDYLCHLKPAVIHHDLKYANVAIVNKPKPQLKLIDFGAALRVRTGSTNESVVATEEYEPPESLDGFAYKVPAWSFDVFSVGIMALEGLCGFKDDAGLDSLRKEVWVEYRRKQSHIVEYMDTLGLKDYEAFCARSIAPLLAPDPYNRPDPIAVRFTASGAVIRKNSAATSAFYLPSEKTSNVSTVTVPTRTTRFS